MISVEEVVTARFMTDFQLASHIGGVAHGDFWIIKMGKSESPRGENCEG